MGQTSAGFYYQNEIQWGPARSMVGLRGDTYRFRVRSALADNSGTAVSGIVSPKGGLVIGPWKGTEIYANAGFGFHSNDGRGTTMTIDPATGEPAERVSPLVRARGAEVGVRTVTLRGVQSTFTLWTLSLDSELIFIGDAGTTEASRPSRRFGFEWTNYVKPRRWLSFEADISVSRARFTDSDQVGDEVPGAVETVMSIGADVENLHRLFAGARLRHFGPRALVEDGRVRSNATTLLNAQAGYEIRRGVRAVVDVVNILNARSSDIDYFYRSRLPGEPPEGVDDFHFHPTLPRAARFGIQLSF